MKSFGIRATKDSFLWAVVEQDNQQIKLVADGKCPAPKTYDEPDALAWYRERVQTLAKQYSVDTAAVRYSETFLGPRAKPTQKTLDSMLKRARVEGVITEALRNAGIPTGVGGWQSISSRMGTRSAKSYTDSGEIRGLDISAKSEEMQHAIAAAISMFGK